MKSVVFSELLILVAVLAVAYLVYQQQGQISDLELELDRVRGAVTGLNANPVPPAERTVDDAPA